MGCPATQTLAVLPEETKDTNLLKKHTKDTNLLKKHTKDTNLQQVFTYFNSIFPFVLSYEHRNLKMSSTAVILHVYDLSQGMARQMSPGLLGTQIDGIWHTGVQVFGREFYFGGGICSDPPNMTPYGRPVQVHDMGSTSKSLTEFHQFLRSIQSRFSMHTYHLLENNCNHFSNVCINFLVAKSIPDDILYLPERVMSTPMGQMLRPMIESMQANIRDASIGHEENLSGGVGLGVASSNPSTAAVTPPLSCESATRENNQKLLIKHSIKKYNLKYTEKHLYSVVVLDKGNPKIIREKLRQVDEKFQPGDENNVNALLESLERIPLEKAFPALDLLRLLAVQSQTATLIAEKLDDLIQKYILPDDAQDPNIMMCLRIAVNCFATVQGTSRLMNSSPEIIATLQNAVLKSLETDSQLASIRVTGAALALNICTSSFRYPNEIQPLEEDPCVSLICAILERLRRWSQDEDSDKNADSERIYLLTSVAALMLTNLQCGSIAKTLEVDFTSVAENSKDTAVQSMTMEIDAWIRNS